MSFTFRCQCGQEFTARPEMVGKTGKCHACGSLMTVPDQSGTVDSSGNVASNNTGAAADSTTSSLPANPNSPPSATANSGKAKQSLQAILQSPIALGVLISAVVVIISYFLQKPLTILVFSVYYLVSLTFVWGACELIRQRHDSPLISAVGGLTFAGIGVVRSLHEWGSGGPVNVIPWMLLLYGTPLISIGVKRLVGEVRAVRPGYYLGIPAGAGIGALAFCSGGLLPIAFCALVIYLLRRGGGGDGGGWGGDGGGWGGDGGGWGGDGGGDGGDGGGDGG